MKISIIEIPNCTRELDGDSFYCNHEEREIVDYVEDHMGFRGHYQTESSGYQCADPDCEEPLDGSPEEDAYDAMVDAQIDRAREDDY